ncbi:MAG: release factor glutamine methyltransferase, partial [Fimbriimonadaceae bacterium]|nr:release factor glutamine methyltransferase [Fimbriimonadaceae bacterium]
GIESARLEAQVLASHVLRVDRAWVLAHPEHDFPELAGESVLVRRLSREPLAYILGWREFYGRRFAVRPGVLIPRQETEVLVDAALEVGSGMQRAKVLDLGTGSGCVGITLALERKEWLVVASDLSFRALQIADDNRTSLGAHVPLVNADRLGAWGSRCFDLIVTNPPYVGEGEVLMPEVSKWEPREALYAGDAGLAFYKALSEEGGRVLRESGVLLTELGINQLEPVSALFESRGWRVLKTWKDLLGVDRVLAATPP